MARHHSPLTHWTQYTAARLAVMALTMCDADRALETAAGLGRGLYAVDQRHRRRAGHNIARSFPELTVESVEALTRDSFELFVQLAVEVCFTPRLIHSDSWPQRVRLTQMGPAIELLNSGRPVLMVTGHLGNWEVLGYLLAVLGYKVHALARPLDNPYINRWLLGIREARGLEVITKWDATDRMLEVIAAGEPLAFIADQNAGDRGMFVPFFGRLASTYKSIGLLALSQNTPIICGYAHRIGPGYRYELGTQDIIYPSDWEGREDPLYYVTARYMRAIEMMVRRAPAQYLWMHRRWKSRPRYEREAKPMPVGLKKNLEALPWMTPAELARLHEPPHPDDKLR